ncbi:uncharacterized protein LOC112453922 [Temnothorax curvispinosus]|uniref:Uncharacterized protein LOC112453922 n=1 Tax=Temnothorax curvispinosus TaxID=300111 RepID=A0A6J1PN29_9HYME|nr:uncharacterized protein LOC112453922 [Temnothorax curvispinosus]
MRVALRAQATAALRVRWKDWVADPRHKHKHGRRVAEAVRPVFEEWVEGVKSHDLTFHAVQILSGHGCFGKYLHSIGKERTTCCWYCPEGADTAQHTLEICPEWTKERRALRAQLGGHLSLPAVVAKLVRPGEEGRDNWRAFTFFASAVLRKKEADERVRRGEAAPPQSDSD